LFYLCAQGMRSIIGLVVCRSRLSPRTCQVSTALADSRLNVADSDRRITCITVLSTHVRSWCPSGDALSIPRRQRHTSPLLRRSANARAIQHISALPRTVSYRNASRVSAVSQRVHGHDTLLPRIFLVTSSAKSITQRTQS
jgi:hypothetical protein